MIGRKRLPVKIHATPIPVNILMDSSLILPLISRWAHVGIAILLVGGTAFFRLAVIPALQGDNADLLGRIRQNWKKFVHAGILIFIVSGVYNFLQAIPLHKGDGLYHALVGIKFLLAMFVFFLASVLVGSKASSQKFRDDAKKWTGVMLMVAAIIVGISGFLKIRGVPPMAPESQPFVSE